MFARLIVFALLILPIFAHANPGKREFRVNFDDGYTKFIDDGNKVILLEVIRPNTMSNSEVIKCYKGSISSGLSTMGKYKIVFDKNYATVNGKVFQYSEKKTDLFPYYDLCR